MATQINPFDSIRAKAGDQERSVSWYQNQIKNLRGISPNKLLHNSPNAVTKVYPGNMYMFFYDAKHKDTLPYWDMFPMVLPFRRVSGGFYGINLHYMPYLARFKLLGILHKFAVDESMSEDNRIKANWSLLSSLSSTAPIKESVKHYLDEHVQSKFLQIKYPDWVTAAMLPVERFVGATKSQVWKGGKP